MSDESTNGSSYAANAAKVIDGHDGKDHKEDAIAVARDILDHLQSPA